MHDFAFSDAVQPDKYQVLGLNLLDYSIGHEILLLRQRNHIIAPKEQFDLLDKSTQRLSIIRAAMVCARTWEENQKPFRWLNLWMWRNSLANFKAEVIAFRAYRECACSIPPMPSKMIDAMVNGDSPGGRSPGSPLCAQLINFVARLPHCKNPFNFSFAQAIFLYFAHLESEGQIKIENHKEAQYRLETEKHLEDIEREQKEAACQT